MVGYALSPAARADVEGIWDYTVRHWGEAQAERYTRDIRDACEALGDGTLSGPVGRRHPGRIPQGRRRLACDVLSGARGRGGDRPHPAPEHGRGPPHLGPDGPNVHIWTS